MVIKAEVREIRREIRKVIAQAHLQVISDIARHCRQRTAARLAQIRHVQYAPFEEELPIFTEAVIAANNVQACAVIEKFGDEDEQAYQ